MKSTNTCKRVSFGNGGSMVETLIIEDIPHHSIDPTEVYRHPFNNNNKSVNDATNNKKLPADDSKHVTITITDTSEGDDSPSSGDRLLHPVEDSPDSPPAEATWPLKRSHSVDSRDNPFLPGGNLSMEAEDILSKATIVRDTFILQDDVENDTSTPHTSPDKQCVNDTENQSPVRETITTDVVQKTQSPILNAVSSDKRPKENGQIDTDNSLTPENVRVELNDDDKDKKKQKKCCSIM